MLTKNKIPILEYDDTYEGLIHAPKLIQKIGVPEYAVLIFFQDVIDLFIRKYNLCKIHELRSQAGVRPVYLMNWEGKKIVVFHPGLGGPIAAGYMEELMALGCTKFIACGGAGVLDSNIPAGSLIVPTKALRDEGTSYHYLPASRYVEMNLVATKAITDTLAEEGIPFIEGITWTTDALYRETREMIAYRKAEGCLTVEMECAAFAAVAEFRKVIYGQMLYGGDDVSKDVFDARQWRKNEIRCKLAELAVKACLKL
jgi:uridine phosphorylase